MNTRVRKLKKWTGKVFGGEFADYNVSVAATSQLKAAKLVSDACNSQLSVNEFRNMFSEVWLQEMLVVVPQDPCVFVFKDNDVPRRIA